MKQFASQQFLKRKKHGREGEFEGRGNRASPQHDCGPVRSWPTVIGGRESPITREERDRPETDVTQPLVGGIAEASSPTA